MSILIFNHGGGKKQLSVTVQGGTSQPTGSFGKLWVNTATQITRSVFMVNYPPWVGSETVGDVWIEIAGGYDKLIFLTTTTNDPLVFVNVLRVRQWNGTAWESKNAYYHNGTSWVQVSNTFNPQTDITYTGTMTYIDDGSGHWRIKLLTSGTLTFTAQPYDNIDAFLVGGGGARGNAGGISDWPGSGGAGYTKTKSNIAIQVGVGYPIVIGAGGGIPSTNSTQLQGGTTSCFSDSVAGGYSGKNISGGAGGSGGGSTSGVGGTNGGNGGTGGQGGTPGAGQGSTTKEFGASDGTLYASGGSWGSANGANNTGNGSGASVGGSGIVVIRDHR